MSNHIRTELSLYTSLVNLGSGLAVGLSALAAGFALGIVGDAGTRSVSQQPRLYVSMVLILIFAEVLGESERDNWRLDEVAKLTALDRLVWTDSSAVDRCEG